MLLWDKTRGGFKDGERSISATEKEGLAHLPRCQALSHSYGQSISRLLTELLSYL